MKLPWNKKYLIIVFHVIIALVAVYALKYGIDFLAYIATNLGEIGSAIHKGISWLMSNFIVVVIAFVISYLLDPIVEFFQKWYNVLSEKYIKNNKKEKMHKKSIFKKKDKKKREKDRAIGTLFTYLFILLIVTLLSWLLIGSISKIGSGGFMENLTASIKSSVSGFQEDLTRFYEKIEAFLVEQNIFEEYVSPQIDKYIQSFTSFIYDIGNNAVSIVTAIGNGILNVLISLVIAFYFLKDKAVIKRKIENTGEAFLPKRAYRFIKNVLGDVHAVFSGYIRGMLLGASIMAVLISVLLSIIGVKFAVIIGIISGFSNVIPYIGAVVGFVLAIAVALISGEPMQALWATIGILALQQIDSIFISPKVVGESVELSPVLVIIALSVAGNLFGLWGMVFAVPTVATIKIFAIRIYRRQKIKKDEKENINAEINA